MGTYKKELIVAVHQLIERMVRLEKLLLDKDVSEPKAVKLLNISEASLYINLAVSTIYSKVSRNEIPVCKKGKRLYFCRSDLNDWIRSGRKKTFHEIKRELDHPGRLK